MDSFFSPRQRQACRFLLAVGLGGALWGSMKAFVALQSAYDDVWEIPIDEMRLWVLAHEIAHNWTDLVSYEGPLGVQQHLGGRLAAGLSARELRLYDVAGERISRSGTISDFGSWISDVAFTPDGERVVAASFDQSAYVHRLSDLARVDSFPTAARVTSALTVGDRVLTTSQDGTTRSWDRRGPVIHRQGEPVYQLSVDRQHTVLSAVGIGPDVVSLFDLSGEDPRPLPPPQAPPGETLWYAGAVAPDASLIAGGTEDGDVLVWPLDGGRPEEPERGAGRGRTAPPSCSHRGTTQPVSFWSMADASGS